MRMKFDSERCVSFCIDHAHRDQVIEALEHMKRLCDVFLKEERK